MEGTKQSYKYLKNCLIGSFLISVSTNAWSNGFMRLEQNVTNMSMAYAGTAALAEDASTNFYNAAGLTRLKHQQLAVGGIAVFQHTVLDVTNAIGFSGASLGSGSVKPKADSQIPLLHYATPINENWAFGISFVSTFGFKTNYKDDSIARYMATRSEMTSFNTAPSIAYNFHNGFSVGAGLDILTVATRLNFAVGNGNINADGFLNNVTHQNAALGGHAGVLYEPNECTRIGLNYRSRIRAHLKGHASSRASIAATTFKLSLNTPIHFPDIVTLSGYHDITDAWAILSDFSWIRWNVFKRIELNLPNGTQALIPTNYKNSWRAAVGAIYKISRDWKVKFGIGFDRTPVRDDSRLIAIPDQDQTTVGIGTKYQINKCLAINFAYAHIFYKKANFNQQAPILNPGPQTVQSLQGIAKSHVDELGVQLNWDIY